MSALAKNSDNIVEIVENGEINRILTTMQEHAHVADFQKHGCCEKQNDVVVAIPAALREHQDDVSVQVSACGALAMLSCNGDIIVAVARHGAINAILKAMHVNRQEAAIQKHGCTVLRNLQCFPIRF